MKKILIVVDMQKDFIDGALGTKEAVAAAAFAADKIRNFDGEIIVTYDTHAGDYMATREGRYLPVPHCIEGTDGWRLHETIEAALAGKAVVRVKKPTFGSVQLPGIVETLAGGGAFTVELIGVCTEICVISNALLLKAHFPETDIAVDPACCAGVTPEDHEAALRTMRSCQIIVR